MLDGRIDTQGAITELRAQGVLDDISQTEEVQVHEDEEAAAESPASEETAAGVVESPGSARESKKPRKLIKDEVRQEGGVQWNIYNTYLKASCVSPVAVLVVGSQGGP